MRASSKALITLVMAATTILFAAKFVSSETGISAITENQFIRDLKSRVDKFMDFIPQDRVYLQFDKTLYQPGETIWFSAYVRDAIDMQPSLKSDMVHVELINPKGTVEKEIILVAKNGKAAGDFQLTAEQLGGIYKVKAYTKWQLNEPDSLYFQKDITVQEVILPTLKMKLDFERKAYGKGDDVTAKLEIATNENQPLSNHAFKYVVNIDGEKLLEKNSETGNDGVMYVRFALPKNLKSNDGILNVMIEHEGKTESISRSIPIVLNNIQLTFYPEGGDMVANADGHIAFKAVNEFGQPADIEGEVKDSKHNVVATFASYYNGMGDFAFTPKPNETYTASVTKPANIETEFQLPVTLATGYNLHIENNYDGRLTVSIYAPAAGEVSLTGNIRGKVVYASSVQCAEGVNNVVISINSFPMGVAQFTLFDNSGSEMCERLTFVNYHKQLQLSITADKEKYLPREKVKLTVLVKDENGSPVAASLSMSVTNDQLLAMADDKQGNMISEMLLQPDVRGKIEEPAFYFSENAKAKKALDYLLMTNGWRRFEWKKILQDPLPIISYQPEQAIITGYVYDISKGTPMPQVTIKAGNKQYQTNGVGYYSIKGIDISKEQEIEFAMQGFDLQKQKIEFYGVHDIQMRPKGYHPPVVLEEVMVREMLEDRVQNAPMQNVAAVEIAAAPRAARKKMVLQEKVKMVAAQNEDIKDKPVAQNKPKREEMKKQRMGFFAADAPMGKAKRNAEDNAGQRDDEAPVAQAAPVYYRSREFAMPDYSTSKASAARTDFRSTIFWNGQIDIDASGKKVFEFYTSDEVTSFRVMVEGIGSNGLIGHSEKTIFTQLPFAISAKFPIELVSEDAVSIPVTLKNNSTKLLSVSINVNAPEVLTAYTPIVNKIDIEPMQAKVIYYNYKTGYGNGEYDFAISATANGVSDATEQKIKVSPKGFPVQQSFSSNQMHDKFTTSLNDVVPGSVDVTLTAYPNIVSDLLKGVDAILREPYGCFEQTSMSSYPNVLVMDYLKTSGQEDPKIMAQAEKLIDKGYKMLTKYEASQRGYEWFGSNPGHEALTAYGLMQFNDMKSVYPNLDEKMIKRTADWLTARKDGKGGFLRDSKALDSYGRASVDITNAYITYALSAAQTPNLEKEIDYSFDKAEASADAYMLALSANSLFDHNRDRRGEKIVKELLKMQNENGSWTGKSHSITYSTGNALTVETTSIALMALLKSENVPFEQVNKAANYIVKARNGAGDFGNTQSTIMALKALTAYAKYSKKTNENGNIEFYVDGEQVAKASYEAGRKDAIVLSNLAKFVPSGKHLLEVRYSGCKNPLPYSLAVNYHTTMPVSNKDCKVSIKSKLAVNNAKTGETVRYTVTVTNTTNDGLPSTMAIIAIPAGCTFQPWQLKEMTDKKVMDYYEIRGNKLMAYYRQMKPAEEKTINFDLKAEVPGTYETPASTAYLYYTNELKDWCSAAKLTISK